MDLSAFDRSRTRRVVLAGVSALMLFGGMGAAPASAVSTASGGAAGAPVGGCDPVAPFAALTFSHPTRIDNRFLPQAAGTRYTLTGVVDDGDGPVPHTVVTTITDLTKVINGVTTRAFVDLDYTDGELVEAELAFQAQDDTGRVWNLGEYPEEYEDGVFAGAPSTWIAGLSSARAGLHMRAHPRTGTSRYLQGLASKIDFLDCGKVISTGGHLCVKSGCYQNVLVVDENSPLDPEGGHQRKFYAPGIGNIKVTAVEDPMGETLELTRIAHLGPDAMSDARDVAFALERRAYRVSTVYQHTPPMHR